MMRRTSFIDSLATGRISRRDALKAAAAFGVGMAIKPPGAQAAEVLTCMEWAGFDDPAYFSPFESKHGTPNFSTFSGEEEALAKVRAGFNADMMHPCNYSVGRFVEAGLTVPVDTAKLSNWKDVFPELQTANGVVVDGNVVMVPADWGSSSIIYRPDLIGDAFKDGESWSIFFDDAFEGKVALLDDPLVIALGAMVKGMPYKQANLLTGTELQASLDFAAKAVRNSRFLGGDQTEVQQALASGEIVAAYAWNDAVKNLKGEGINIAYARPKEGYFTWFCGLTILNSGKADPALAYDFIDAWLSPETGKLLIEGSGYGHSNMKSFEAADPKQVEAMGITDPVEFMKSATLFEPQPSAVVNEQTEAWEQIKALKL
ncbi:ABC transporter substrate-binding protein [Agrobacterium sp. ES01]|uniref:ABC transporter substrate-binding protein n=1 Tax=Agrobacterium sp. ES01 TaxID=3420714 RepID=UPI003D0CCDE4